ncbi:DUF4093 domain-containing protein, partial [Streptococcus agalactiae]
GYSNGKQLLKRLRLFGVTKAEVEECMERFTNVRSIESLSRIHEEQSKP